MDIQILRHVPDTSKGGVARELPSCWFFKFSDERIIMKVPAPLALAASPYAWPDGIMEKFSMSTSTKVHVKSPASSANLGPGFDCLAMALDIWNHVTFELTGNTIEIINTGLQSPNIPDNDSNLLVEAAEKIYRSTGQALPHGIRIHSHTNIPVRAGLGASSATIVAGMACANALLGSPYTSEQMVKLAGSMEGHNDSIVASALGGLILTAGLSGEINYRRVEIPELPIVVCIPLMDKTTKAMRRLIPRQIDLSQAVSNMGNALMTVEMLQSGELDGLNTVMQDKLHQPYRLPLIPGAQQAMDAAIAAGGKGAALASAGPSIIVFCDTTCDLDAIGQAMVGAFEKAGMPATYLLTKPSIKGVQILED